MDEQPLVEMIEERLANDIESLPVFNRVAMTLQEIIQKDDYCGDDLAVVLQKDQALATQTLKIANSAFYAGLNPVKTVKEAVVRLGANSLTGILHLFSQKVLYRTRVRQFKPWIDALWTHSLGTAIASKWLAENLGYGSAAENAFLAGLLHDIGKLVQLRIIDELLVTKSIKSKLSLNLVLEIMEDLHTKHGRIYLEKQNIPESYWVVALRHHDSKVTPENMLLNIVRLGNKACHKLALGMTENPDIMLSTLPEAHSLMAKDIVLAELLVEIDEQMTQLDHLL